jgi:hypothetical protein
MQTIQRLNYLATVHVPYCQMRSAAVFAAQLRNQTINTNGNPVEYYRLYQDLQHGNDYSRYNSKYIFKRYHNFVHLFHLTTLTFARVYFFYCGIC